MAGRGGAEGGPRVGIGERERLGEEETVGETVTAQNEAEEETDVEQMGRVTEQLARDDTDSAVSLLIYTVHTYGILFTIFPPLHTLRVLPHKKRQNYNKNCKGESVF